MGKRLVWLVVAVATILGGGAGVVGIAQADRGTPYPEAAPVAFSVVAQGVVSPDFHARRDGNRVFYAGSQAETRSWLPYTGPDTLSFRHLDFKRYALLAIFFRQAPNGAPVVTSVEPSTGSPVTIFVHVEIRSVGCTYPPGTPPPPCVVSFWDPSLAFFVCTPNGRCDTPVWGKFILLLIDKRGLSHPPERLCVTSP